MSDHNFLVFLSLQRLPVETDPEKLVNYVCGSHPVKENREDLKIKDDSEYPEWLWTLRTGECD